MKRTVVSMVHSVTNEASAFPLRTPLKSNVHTFILGETSLNSFVLVLQPVHVVMCDCRVDPEVAASPPSRIVHVPSLLVHSSVAPPPSITTAPVFLAAS